MLLDKRVDGGDRKLYQLKAVKEICYHHWMGVCVLTEAD